MVLNRLMRKVYHTGILVKMNREESKTSQTTSGRENLMGIGWNREK